MHDNLTIGDLVAERIVWQDTPDVRIDMVRRGDEIHIETYWKTVSAVLDANRETAANFSKSSSLGDLVRVADIPTGLYYEKKAEGVMDDPERLARFLNDSDYSKVRTNSLRV